MKPTQGTWHVVEYAGRFEIQDGGMYGDNNLLDADMVGYDQAKANAEHICDLHNNQSEISKAVNEKLKEVNDYIEENLFTLFDIGTVVYVEDLILFIQSIKPKP